MSTVCTPLDLSRSDITLDMAGISLDMVETCVVGGARSGRRYRVIEDVLERQLNKEEKTLTKQRKQLVILQKKAAPTVDGALYQQTQERIEKLEAKIDDRMERIAELMLRIQEGFDEEEDDEEVLLMS